MRILVLFLITCTWVSFAGAANYPVGSNGEAEALRYVPDPMELYYKALIERLEKNTPP